MGGKKSKNLLVMANMDGSDKRKLLVIGKSLKPRCFKGVNLNSPGPSPTRRTKTVFWHPFLYCCLMCLSC